MRCAGLLVLVSLASCGGGDRTVGMPPCNAWIFLWGNADLRLDCPASSAIPVLERTAPKPAQKPAPQPKPAPVKR